MAGKRKGVVLVTGFEPTLVVCRGQASGRAHVLVAGVRAGIAAAWQNEELSSRNRSG